MKAQAYLWIITALVFAVFAGIYITWSLWDTGPAATGGNIEWTGTVALVFSVFFGLMVGFWLWQAARRSERQHGLPPEDTHTGEIDENAGEYGFFSPHSWWPLFCALAVAFTAVGVAIGWWMVLIGGFAIVLTSIGWVFEYYRKEFQH
ncbi:cytochrome c oxidase subunit 4 [Lipingzhangella sp. LS1_29]|uniref:Cytochrome c oxidase polypeptide 4 n=1 Tax=Lipingzhangella rawalii TaxID=2055835 RepID=A0ABU2H054_9ACTN|nr:cytochrome c oxidase subunit 4 [Lipingzhangella rawalii]MDS1268686.1 cytochrome c oxidase subunit 4 [Lipingzhangella rawalii]